MTDALIALGVGLIIGWLAGRRSAPSQDGGGAHRYRPSRRQRKILETLEPSPDLPSIEELVIEEATETGVLDIPGAVGTPIHVRLKAWKRDHEREGPCDGGHWEFQVRAGVDPSQAAPEDVSLRCVEERSPESPG